METQKFDSLTSRNLTARELLVECGTNLRDAELWEEFYSRFRRKVTTFLLRAFLMSGGRSGDFVRYADDWVQDVFTKLIQHDGRAIRSFRGTTDLSVFAFLASIAVSTVADHVRSKRALRRRAQVVPIDEAPEQGAPDSGRVSALLDLIDVEKILKENGESKNPDRDLLIFRLHFVEGLTAREIASIATFNLTTSGLEKVLNRLRRRLGGKNVEEG